MKALTYCAEVVASCSSICVKLTGGWEVVYTEYDGTSGGAPITVVGGTGILNPTFPRNCHLVDNGTDIVIELCFVGMLRNNSCDVHVLWLVSDLQREIQACSTDEPR
jgi:hypothetical protein